MSVLRVVLVLIRNIVADQAELAAENLALRQQLAVLIEQQKRPRLRKRDRIFARTSYTTMNRELTCP